MKRNDGHPEFTDEERQRALDIIARYRSEPVQLTWLSPQGYEDFLAPEASNDRR